jgi:predicted short-subunit dehydrogenase-like oxidoreductase (DUF2520 family)
VASTIAVFGAGRVGRGLAHRLHRLGWRIGAVVTRSKATARTAVRKIGAGAAYGAATRQILNADVVFITTPDDAVANAAADLADLGREEWRGKIVLHTSGALDRDDLAPLAHFGASTGSLHPLQTFSGRTVPELEGIVIAIEGDRAALRMARKIVRALGGIPLTLLGRDKPMYHAAGALVAGHALALVEAATLILMSIGFTRRQSNRSLLPLMRQMLANFERLGPRLAWTGPLSRGDYETIARHREAFRGFPREFSEAYLALSLLAARVLSANPELMQSKIHHAWKQSAGGRT